MIKISKNLLIITLIYNCLLPNKIQSNFFDSLTDKMKDIGNQAINIIKEGSNKLKEGIEIAGHKIVDCSKVVGLGIATVSTQAGQEILQDFKKSSEAVAFQSAENFLKDTKQAVGGIMDLATKILEDITNNFKIECARFVGQFNNIYFEFKAKVLSKEININEKFQAKNLDDLSNQIYKRILKEFGIKDIF